MVKYAEGLHWHQLLAFSDRKLLMYHEPYGGSLASRAPIARAFATSKGPPAGWELVSLRVTLQSCTWECGIWEDFVSEVAADFVASDSALSFEAYLRARAEITPLDGLKGAPKETAKVKNNTFIAQRRVTARKLLRDAFERQLLPHEGDAGSALALFNEGGSVRKPIVLEDDDDE